MEDITVQELKAKMDNKEDYLLIDVREPMEYQMFNLNGRLMPLGSFVQHFDELEEYKDTEIVIHCRSGQRSATAKHLMERAGFTKVRNLLGGVLAWIDMES